uniref:Uncharacterized protein n=1 Tax=Arundo donax TaxID=35708 RepID=A0A0A9EJI3_ARUDO
MQSPEPTSLVLHTGREFIITSMRTRTSPQIVLKVH